MIFIIIAVVVIAAVGVFIFLKKKKEQERLRSLPRSMSGKAEVEYFGPEGPEARNEKTYHYGGTNAYGNDDIYGGNSYDGSGRASSIDASTGLTAGFLKRTEEEKRLEEELSRLNKTQPLSQNPLYQNESPLVKPMTAAESFSEYDKVVDRSKLKKESHEISLSDYDKAIGKTSNSVNMSPELGGQAPQAPVQKTSVVADMAKTSASGASVMVPARIGEPELKISLNDNGDKKADAMAQEVKKPEAPKYNEVKDAGNNNPLFGTAPVKKEEDKKEEKKEDKKEDKKPDLTVNNNPMFASAAPVKEEIKKEDKKEEKDLPELDFVKNQKKEEVKKEDKKEDKKEEKDLPELDFVKNQKKEEVKKEDKKEDKKEEKDIPELDFVKNQKKEEVKKEDKKEEKDLPKLDFVKESEEEKPKKITDDDFVKKDGYIDTISVMKRAESIANKKPALKRVDPTKEKDTRSVLRKIEASEAEKKQVLEKKADDVPKETIKEKLEKENKESIFSVRKDSMSDDGEKKSDNQSNSDKKELEKEKVLSSTPFSVHKEEKEDAKEADKK